MAPPSRRRVLPAQNLSIYGATPLYPPNDPSSMSVDHDAGPTSVRMPPTTTVARVGPSSRASHQHPGISVHPIRQGQTSVVLPSSRPLSSINQLTGAPSAEMEIAQPHGVRIGKWKIITQNSSIGDEKGMENLTSILEEAADPLTPLHSTTVTTTNETAMALSPNKHANCARGKRRLCPPEITFLNAFVSLQFIGKPNKRYDATHHKNKDAKTGEEARIINAEIKFTALDALMEWAEAHRYLEQSRHDSSARQIQQQKQQDHTQQEENPSNQSSLEQCRGVSILKTVDAAAWSKRTAGSKNTAQQSCENHNDGVTVDQSASKSEFYYDWTFASPYAGSIKYYDRNDVNSTQKNTINNRHRWKPLAHSHIPFHVLQDTSQPILLYDDILLYEDDLHDNGDVSLNIKVRVMPRCWYILQRLFIRVDYVCVKCRDIRMFCWFDEYNNCSAQTTIPSQHDDISPIETNVIYRDVSWREASWEELGKMGLPQDPAVWRETNDLGGGRQGGGVVAYSGTAALRVASMVASTPPLATLLMKLPVVSLPSDLPAFSHLDL